MEEVDHEASSTDPMLACCQCRRLLRDAVQLICLHNCCRQCFSTAASTGNNENLACGSCDTITQAGRERPNGFIDRQVQRHKLITESKVCGKCKENGECEAPAVVWCPACRHSLCEGCIALHKQYFKQHSTQSLDELRSLSEVISLESPSVCPIHKKPLDIACRNCEQAKCTTCWAECNEKKHEMHVVGKDSFDSYISEFVACISTMERELLQKSKVLEKPKSVLRDTKTACDRHLNDLKKRKRLVIDTVEMVYQEMEFMTKNIYDNLEAEGDSEAAAAERIASHLSVARRYIRLLIESNDKCEILKQQKIIRERLSVLSAQIDTLSDRLATTAGEVKVETSLPDDLEQVVRAWIGMPQFFSALASTAPSPLQHLEPAQQQPEQLLQQPEQQQQEQLQQEQQHFSFGAPSASLQLPVECADIALTTDGRSLLLAAQRHGLIEICSSSGRELSRWLPPEHKPMTNRDGYNDVVLSVAALSDERAAVSLRDAKLVVLLRRRKRGAPGGQGAAAEAAAGEVWTVDRHLCELTESPGMLSAHGDVLAVYLPLGFWLRVMNASSGQRLSADLLCRYRVNSLAVAERAVVIGVETSGVWVPALRAQCPVYELDALDLAYGQRLWSHELITNCSDRKEEWEDLHGICVDSKGGFVYAAVAGSDWSTGRVSELSLADGRELQRFALSFDQSAACRQLLMPPWRISLREDVTATDEQQRQQRQQSSSSRATSSSSHRRALLLAALCRDSKSKLGSTVTLHRSIGGNRL